MADTKDDTSLANSSFPEYTPNTTSADPKAFGLDVKARAKEHPQIDRSHPGGLETAPKDQLGPNAKPPK